MKAKKLKIIGIAVMTVVIVCLIAGFIYFDKHYAVINKKIYRNDIKTIRGTNLTKKDDIDYWIDFDITNIREVNKCTELEDMELEQAKENTISQLNDFPNMKYLEIFLSYIGSADIEKINSFNLEELYIHDCFDVDFTGFNSDTIPKIIILLSDIKNLKPLAECKSIKDLSIIASTIPDYIIEEPFRNYVLKDSSIFADFDYVENLYLSLDEIEDISGILEMDSLKVLKVHEGDISEDNVKLLEDKGVTVTYYEN
ncbi:MAG: hypothetical protein K2K16_10490 [Ruminococcus sp.]|nr:hypothetical protein [Ruminococcus sp.]